MTVKIKICGFTRPEDARLADRLGADFIGIIFSKHSRRQVDLDRAADIVADLQNAVPVGVFVEQDFDETLAIAQQAGIKIIQHHTLFDQKFPGFLYIHAAQVRDRIDPVLFEHPSPDFILLDTYKDRQFGGTGESFDWGLIKPEFRDRLFLSGGIGIDNGLDALSLRPYAIDLSSSLEQSPGLKDPDKMEQFFRKIHHDTLA